MHLPPLPTLPDVLRQRRQRLATFVKQPLLLWSGGSPSRNFPANRYPFRASSHFLYFAGLPIPEAVVQILGDRLTLFWDEPPASAALWHGPSPSREAIAAAIGADAAYPLAALTPPSRDMIADWAVGAATVPLPQVAEVQRRVLGRPVPPLPKPALTPEPLTLNQQWDLALAKAIVAVRSAHDALALDQMRQAAAVSVAAHRAGMMATAGCETEAQVRSAMEAVIVGEQMTLAYNSIVTVEGQVLHNEVYGNAIGFGDLLLADVGAETVLGWAADITRTWPVSGQFSPTQKAVYEVVLAAHDRCIAALKPGVEYRDIHLLGCKVLAEGLVALGILKGDPESLVARDAHALFFPHGIGHLLGLDVHDMEDLGDWAGYGEGRMRSPRFGLGYLRLNRPLLAEMVVTIEPGFYQVPAILEDAERRAQYQDCVNWSVLEQFADVRGIRIEDDVRITKTGAEVLTADLPTSVAAIEALLAA